MKFDFKSGHKITFISYFRTRAEKAYSGRLVY
jgi:hypothetical protein